MKHLVILTRIGVLVPRRDDRLSFLFADGAEDDLDLIADLVDDWNETSHPTCAEFMPVAMVMKKHNAEHDRDRYIFSEIDLRRFYRAIVCDAETTIDHLNLQKPLSGFVEITNES